jgi:hypothetical protein
MTSWARFFCWEPAKLRSRQGWTLTLMSTTGHGSGHGSGSGMTQDDLLLKNRPLESRKRTLLSFIYAISKHKYFSIYPSMQQLYLFVTPSFFITSSAADKYWLLVRLALSPVLPIMDWPLFHWPLVRLASIPDWQRMDWPLFHWPLVRLASIPDLQIMDWPLFH